MLGVPSARRVARAFSTSPPKENEKKMRENEGDKRNEKMSRFQVEPWKKTDSKRRFKAILSGESRG